MKVQLRKLNRQICAALLGTAMCCLLSWCASPNSESPSAILFDFHSDFWLNLHLDLYRQAKPDRTQKIATPPNPAWDTALAYYKTNLVSHDLTFDSAMIDIKMVRRAIPGYVPYAEANGLWKRAWPMYFDPLNRDWKPYLEGSVSFADAVSALVKDVGQPKPNTSA